MSLMYSPVRQDAPSVDGKFLTAQNNRFLIKGVSYGTFAPRADGGGQFPAREQIAQDFAAMRRAGINTVRLYTAPAADVLEQAAQHDLRLMIGLPWTQHVAFLDDEQLRRDIRREIVAQVRALHQHPTALLFALGNEIPPTVVRWHGQRKVEQFLRELYEDAKAAAPDALLTYVNYPPTEYLELPFFDVCSFNVYLHDERKLRDYLTRLQHIAGQKPLLIAEAGADSMREGRAGQASLTAMQLRAAFQVGACGAVAYAWTDEWWRGGNAVEDWAFGLVDADRRPKPALEAVSRVFAFAPFDEAARASWPRVSVVVCAYNAQDTIDECLTSLERLTYPNYEVVVVNDGSRDATAEIVSRHPRIRLIDVPNGGLSLARNIGMRAATGEVVAYLDSDAFADPQWLDFLVQPMLDSSIAGSGGPNVVPRSDPWLAQCVARAPGGPTHVLLTDHIAEHVPGCNMAFRRDALLAIDGFNPVYLRAGDDVDLCWRIQSNCGPIGFAPSALVWHRHRASVKAYWKQQVGYGEGEEWLRPYHPDKFVGRHILWHGLVYSPLPFVKSMSGQRVNAGVWGTAPFPSVYRVDRGALSYLPHSGQWQVGSIALVLAGALLALLGVSALGALVAVVGGVGLAFTVVRCLLHAWHSDIRTLPAISGRSRRTSHLVYRLTIAWLHFIQPLARLHGRVRGVRDWPATMPRSRASSTGGAWQVIRAMSGATVQQRFWSETWVDARAVLTRLVERLRITRVGGDIAVDDGWWVDRDLSVAVAPGLSLDVRSLVEEHAAGKCLWRSRLRLRGGWLLAALAAPVLGAGIMLVRGDTPPTLLSIAALLASAVLFAAGSRVIERVRVTTDAVARVAEQLRMYDIVDHRPAIAARLLDDQGPGPADMVRETQ